MRHLCVAVALACIGTATAAFSRSPQWVQPARGQQQEALNRMYETNARADQGWETNYDRQNRDRIEDLPKIRQHLADAWRHFGMKPDAAKAVASTYVFDQPNLADPPSIKGKSDQEVASMMQAALSAKQYLRANQLLIQYERRRLHLPQTKHH